MFSDKIVCAIRVMNLLAYSPPGQRSARGIDAGFLKELLGVEYSLYKSVINTLIIGNICYTTARMVYLGKGVERVTVYDLMYLFHKGLPMGAATEIEEELRQRLKSMHVLALLHPEAENTSGEETGRRPADSPGETIRDQIPAHADSPLPEPS